MSKIIVAFCVLMACVLCAPFAWGHTGEVHEIEMLSVWGISPEDQALAERLHPVIEVFRKNIDVDYKDFYKGLKAIMLPYKFSWGTYTHRIFFHWAFNGDPRNNSAALKNCFIESRADPATIETGYKYILYVGSDSPEGEEISRLLTNANNQLPEEERIHSIPKGQKVRNRALINAVAALEHAPKDENNAVATILYDTHIIGDFIEGELDPRAAMTPLKDIVDDIVKHGVRKIDCDINLQNECEDAMRQAMRSAATEPMKAQAVLDAMRVCIPKCVSNSKVIKKIVWGDKTPSGIKSQEDSEASSKKKGFWSRLFGKK